MWHITILFTYRPFENTNKMTVSGTKSTWVVRKFSGGGDQRLSSLVQGGNRFAFVTQGSPSAVLKRQSIDASH